MEFQVDCGSVQEANAYMASEVFAANPVGVAIDPEQLLASYRTGGDAATLLRMPPGPASAIPSAYGMT